MLELEVLVLLADPALPHRDELLPLREGTHRNGPLFESDRHWSVGIEDGSRPARCVRRGAQRLAGTADCKGGLGNRKIRVLCCMRLTSQKPRTSRTGPYRGYSGT